MKIGFMFFLWFATSAYAQDYTFTFVENYKDQNRLKFLADSLKSPLLFSATKVYAIGSSCVSRLLDGDINDRDNDGDNNNRFKAGDNDERNKSGEVGDRVKKGKTDKRNKRGKADNRYADGDSDSRDAGGDVDTRTLAGGISVGNRCSIAKNGKVLLYTRQVMDAKKSNIFFQDRSFNSKHFKIIQL